MSLPKLPRGTIKKYKEHLNKEHGLVKGSDKIGGVKKGQQKQLYGDYHYSADHEKFISDMYEEIRKGTFKP